MTIFLTRLSGYWGHLESRDKVNSLGKNLLECCETIPDICGAAKSHYAKSLKTKAYCAHAIGRMHASIDCDYRRTRDFPRNAFRLCSAVLSWLGVLARGFRHSRNSLCDQSISYFLLAEAPATTGTNLPDKFVIESSTFCRAVEPTTLKLYAREPSALRTVTRVVAELASHGLFLAA